MVTLWLPWRLMSLLLRLCPAGTAGVLAGMASILITWFGGWGLGNLALHTESRSQRLSTTTVSFIINARLVRTLVTSGQSDYHVRWLSLMAPHPPLLIGFDASVATNCFQPSTLLITHGYVFSSTPIRYLITCQWGWDMGALSWV